MKYILVATNQDVLLFKLLTSWGVLLCNRDVLLTEACYCSRLFGISNQKSVGMRRPSNQGTLPLLQTDFEKEQGCVIMMYE